MKALYWTMASIFILTTPLIAQDAPQKKSFVVEKGLTINMRTGADFNPVLENRKLPKPHPGTDKVTIENIKTSMLPLRDKRSGSSMRTAVVDSLLMLRNFMGNSFNGYVPNDNDVAVSNNDVVCSVGNTTIQSKDLLSGMTYGSFTLHSITSGLGLQQEEFDPKVLYDPTSDRFIFVCLNGFTDSTSNVLVGFSEDSTSYGNWNFYSLPGNPLNNSLWTDFPMIAVNNGYLFITVNLLYNDSTWQAGFNQSIVWQIDKSQGISGSTLTPLLHYNFTHNGEPVRNLCPVKGGSTTYGPEFYFLSNRNFAASNDTIFLVNIPSGPSPVPTLQPVVASKAYHMPADADQPFTDKLQVNDARFLGAFYEFGVIQAVASTLDTTSGYDGIYHLRMDNLTAQPAAIAEIYISAPYDLAYPNIAYAGTSVFSNASVISVLKSSSTVFPGCGAVYFDANGDYSGVKSIKEGVSYTNMLTGIERWGDYTGCQTKYNEPGKVWVNGSYSIVSHTTRTWVAELVPSLLSSNAEVTEPEADLTVYPNPATDQINVAFTMPNDGVVRMEVLDASGRLVKVIYHGSIAAGDNRFSFSPQPLSSGTYVLRISNDKGSQLGITRFVKK